MYIFQAANQIKGGDRPQHPARGGNLPASQHAPHSVGATPSVAGGGVGGHRRRRRRRHRRRPRGDGTTATTASTAATDRATREGHDETTSKTYHIWVLSELDPLLLSPCPNTMHATREVSEDPMLEEVAVSFATTSASTCATSTMVSHPRSVGSRLGSTASRARSVSGHAASGRANHLMS
jgi:hypothetical protein